MTGIWLAALVAGASPARAEDPLLVAARADFAAYPEDYGTAVHLAVLAQQHGAHAEALDAWSRAEALAGRNLETLAGPVPALVSLERFGEARARAEAARVYAPDAPGVWTLRGWSTRFRPTLPDAGRRTALASYRHATTLAPEDAGAWCGVGWTRFALGEVRGARAALERSRDLGGAGGCAQAGLDALPPDWTVDVGATAFATTWVDHPWRTTSAASGVRVAARWTERLALDVTARRTGIHGEQPDASAPPDDGGQPPGGGEPPDGGQPPPPAGEEAPDAAAGAVATTPVTYTQNEAWIGLGAFAGGHGAEAVFGTFGTTGDAGSAGQVLGLRAWSRVGVTPIVEAASTGYASGASQRQAGAGVMVPVWRGLQVGGGARWTALSGTDDDDELGGSATSGWGRVAWDDGRSPWSASATIRVGREYRPVRFDGRAVWNIDDPLTASASAAALWWLHPALGVTGGAEWARLDNALDPMAGEAGLSETGSAVLVFAGITARPTGARTRGEGR